MVMHRCESKIRGFTLIELLIVVAIIAILAAIAVPNFLEAQVRSKVARAKSDMRTIDIAVQSYTVDHNREPIGIKEIRVHRPEFPNSPQTQDWCYARMTTPIAYITSVPKDPFMAVAGQTLNRNLRAYNYDSIYPPVSFFQWNQLRNHKGVHWALYSYGPKRTMVGKTSATGIAGPLLEVPDNATQSLYPSAYYDPTNGTVSFGWLIRTNRGIEPYRNKS